MCAVIIAYVTLTHAIWAKLTGRLFDVNDCIRDTVTNLNGGTDVRRDATQRKKCP